MGVRARIAVVIVAALAGPVVVAGVAAPPPAVAAGTQRTVGTVEEFWDAWTDPDVTQIDLENDIELVTYNNDTGDYSTCDAPGEDTYPERHPNGDTLVDGHGFTLSMRCDGNAVLASSGTHTLTVQRITITHFGGFGNGIAMEDLGGDVVVIDSTITQNGVSGSCGSVGAPAVGTASSCIPVGGGIASGGDVTVSGSTISDNETDTFGGGIFANGFLTMTDSVVTGNAAIGSDDSESTAGGGVFANQGSSISRVDFTGNRAECGGFCSGPVGGAMVTGPATVTDSSFADNFAGCIAFCGDQGGAIYAVGDFSLSGSTVTGNSTTCGHGCETIGGGIFADGDNIFGATAIASMWGGAGIAAGIEPGVVTITDSTIADNVATALEDDLAMTCTCAGGGLAVRDQAVIVTGSTFSANEAQFDGGAIWLTGEVPLTVTNSTITGNRAANGAIASDGPVTLAYVTLVGNVVVPAVRDDTGFGPLVGGAVDLDAAILRSFGTVATGARAFPNCTIAGATTSDGWNFSDDSTCGFTNTGSGDSESPSNDPTVGALASNGGPTQTMLPAAGSPLLDAIPIASCQAGPTAGVTVDQRGVVRPQGSGCDIGAVEVVVAVPAIEPTFTG